MHLRNILLKTFYEHFQKSDQSIKIFGEACFVSEFVNGSKRPFINYVMRIFFK